MRVGENENAKFWTIMLDGFRNRGVEDIFIACTDNLISFTHAIAIVFPKTNIQNCIIHQLRNSNKYVSQGFKSTDGEYKGSIVTPDEVSALNALKVF